MRRFAKPGPFLAGLTGICAVLSLHAGFAAGGVRAPIALGVNIANAPDHVRPLRRYVRLVHRRPALVMWYQQWSEPLTWSTQLPNTRRIGAVPMITWDPILNGAGIPLAKIAAGDDDRYIRASAAAAASWGKPIYIRFGHEMNLTASPFGVGRDGNTSAGFVGAWKHVVTIFRRAGATNVEWVWSPNVDCAGRCPFARFYPGNAWVDWVGLDGYNYSLVDHQPWMSFAQIFGHSYRSLTRISSKPVMIAETATSGQGGSKARWITHSFASIPRWYPRIHAVVWFDRVKETNWTVNSSRASLTAWRRVVSSRLYRGSARTLLRVVPVERDVARVSLAIAAAAGL